MIVCGWCGHPTKPETCETCGRDPVVPWEQRGLAAPKFDPAAERAKEQAARLTAARRALIEAGAKITNAALAEAIGVDEKTVRRWMSAK